MNHKELTILFKQTVEKMEKILIAKGHDYSQEEDRLSNFNISAANIGIKPVLGALYMCGIKITRLSNLIKNNKEPKHESVMDSFIDLINYAFLSYCCYKQNGIEVDEIDEEFEINVGLPPIAYTVKDIDSEFWHKVTVAYRIGSAMEFCDKVNDLIKAHNVKVNSFLASQPSSDIRSRFSNYKPQNLDKLAGEFNKQSSDTEKEITQLKKEAGKHISALLHIEGILDSESPVITIIKGITEEIKTWRDNTDEVDIRKHPDYKLKRIKDIMASSKSMQDSYRAIEKLL